MIEVGPLHLVAVRVAFVGRERERKLHAGPGSVRDEFRARLKDAHRVDFLAHAEPVEDLEVERQERFPDMEARMLVLLDHDHVRAAFGEQSRRGGARGSAADDEHVA